MSEIIGEQEFNGFVDTVRSEMDAFTKQMNANDYQAAVELILTAQANGNRVHVTGIGKPSHVAAYAASLLSSTGTPTYFLHGTEATHGSCGQLLPGDVVVCLSNSGETAELKATAMAILNNGCHIVAITGNGQSWLAAHAQAHLTAHVEQEGGPLNRAPRASILAETLAIQGLSVILQAHRGLDPKQYVKWHPGGSLGKLREDEK